MRSWSAKALHAPSCRSGRKKGSVAEHREVVGDRDHPQGSVGVEMGSPQRTFPKRSVITNPAVASVTPLLGQAHATLGLNFCPIGGCDRRDQRGERVLVGGGGGRRDEHARPPACRRVVLR